MWIWFYGGIIFGWLLCCLLTSSKVNDLYMQIGELEKEKRDKK